MCVVCSDASAPDGDAKENAGDDVDEVDVVEDVDDVDDDDDDGAGEGREEDGGRV